MNRWTDELTCVRLYAYGGGRFVSIVSANMGKGAAKLGGKVEPAAPRSDQLWI